MITAALIAKAGPLAVEMLTDELVGEAKEVLVARIKEQLSAFDGDAQFQAALAAEREQILWNLHGVVIALARAITGKDLDADAAVRALKELAMDPTTRRRFRSLVNEAANSTDERIAMLAVGYFVGGQPPILRERLDWAVRGLLPADAAALSVIVELADQLQDTEHLMLFERDATKTWTATRASHGRSFGDDRSIDPQCATALHNAQCISLGNWLNQPNPQNVVTWRSEAIPADTRMRNVELLPVGREMHAVLTAVDWREIARRGGTAAAE